MSRTASHRRPEELRAAIIQYLVKHGIADLSLRPLAKAVGSSPRVLLYYFGSKEKIVAKALAEIRDRQRTTYDQMQAPTFEQACRAIWMHMSAPKSGQLYTRRIHGVELWSAACIRASSDRNREPSEYGNRLGRYTSPVGALRTCRSLLFPRSLPRVAVQVFRFPLQHFRLGNGHDGAENALKVAELIVSVALRYQFG